MQFDDDDAVLDRNGDIYPYYKFAYPRWIDR